MRERAMQRIKEIDTLSGALGDMSSLDYAIKTMINEDRWVTEADAPQLFRKCTVCEMERTMKISLWNWLTPVHFYFLYSNLLIQTYG